ncbi:MAG: toprim domain-containing protein [Alphaproteobacteria bacterium]|nr:toprim domain-containing protein [Alphaproteobacteria bacterium]
MFELIHIKRLIPESLTTPIIICADHDAPDSPASQILERSIRELKERGLAVTVIKPDKLNEDFNDVLKTQDLKGLEKFLNAVFLKVILLRGAL